MADDRRRGRLNDKKESSLTRDTSRVTTPARAASPGTPASAPSSATLPTRSSAARTAGSASPSVAAGVPHTAITTSPMNFSTTPLYRPITVRATAKYWDSSSQITAT